MTDIALRAGRLVLDSADFRVNANAWRLLPFALVLALISLNAELRTVTLGALSDAYLAVSVFVAGTLAVVYLFESSFKADIGKLLERSGFWQSPFAAILGALPGCGGAIIVITQYARGYVSFGGVVAVLVATMGDAAFLLLAREPSTGAMIFVLGFVVGTISGWIVDAIHGRHFMRAKAGDARASCLGKLPDEREVDRWLRAFDGGALLYQLNRIWLALLVPGIILGGLLAFQVDTDVLFGPLGQYGPTEVIGAAGALLCLAMWALARDGNSHAGRMATAFSRRSVWARMISDTNFITTWVIFGFLVYEVAVHAAGSGIETFFQVWAPFVPAMAVIVGFLPGCGPQIVVTTLYLTGIVPLSAQIGNAISNDGDALFPAIALAPRAAVLATLYSAVPALIFAYGYYFLFEIG